MEIKIEPHDSTAAIVRIAGRLDAASAPELRASLGALIEQGSVWLILDLEHVKFMDSTGLGALVAGFKAARAVGGGLSLLRPAQQCDLLLRLTALDRVFPVFPTLEEALSTVRAALP